MTFCADEGEGVKGGGKFFRALDAPQLCCGVLHFNEKA